MPGFAWVDPGNALGLRRFVGLRCVVLIVAAVVLLSFQPSALGQGGRFHRDWTNHPPIVELDTEQDIFVVGDVHGDYERLVAVLIAAGIIGSEPPAPDAAEWHAGGVVLVFTGDLIDKGSEALRAIALIRALDRKAADNGARVVVLMGNHEAEFLDEPTNDKAEEFVAELNREDIDPGEIAACQGDLGEYLCNLPFAARVNDWFFSHGGNTDGHSLDKLATKLREGVNKEGFHTPELVGKKSLLRARLDSDHPWFREGDQDEKEVLTSYAEKLGVKHMVQGHEPGNVKFSDHVKRKGGTMFQRYGLLFLVDVGMSGADKSAGAALHIKTKQANQAEVVCPSGEKTVIWDDRQRPKLGQARPCK